MIHGWNSGPDKWSIEAKRKLLRNYENKVNILIVDWSGISRRKLKFDIDYRLKACYTKDLGNQISALLHRLER